MIFILLVKNYIKTAIFSIDNFQKPKFFARTQQAFMDKAINLNFTKDKIACTGILNLNLSTNNFTIYLIQPSA